MTRVEGLPALLMELVDTDDPVEVGKETSYEIRVTNTGTKTETNLQVTCTLPEGMELRGTKGAFGCAVKQEGRDLVFAPLPNVTRRCVATLPAGTAGITRLLKPIFSTRLSTHVSPLAKPGDAVAACAAPARPRTNIGRFVACWLSPFPFAAEQA